MGETMVVERAAVMGFVEAVYWELIEVVLMESCLVDSKVTSKAELMAELKVSSLAD
jgi:hypothetical protein